MKEQAAVDNRVLQMVAVGDLYASEGNARKAFPAEQLQELAESIKAKGIIEPLIVRAHSESSTIAKAGGYEIVAGERRWRAAKLAKLAVVPCVVCEMNDDEALEAGLLENLQRADLSPLEEAEGLSRLLEAQKRADHIARGGADTADAGAKNPQTEEARKKKLDSAAESVARKVGKSAKYVYDRIKLLDLTIPAQEALKSGKIEAGHAIELARVDEKAQGRLLERIKPAYRSDPITVRQLRDEVKADARRQVRQKQRSAAAKKTRKNPAAAAKADNYQGRWREEDRKRKIEERIEQRMLVLTAKRALDKGFSKLEWEWLTELAQNQVEHGDDELVAEAMGLTGKQRNRKGLAKLKPGSQTVLRLWFAAVLIAEAGHGFGTDEKNLVGGRLSKQERAAIRAEIENEGKPKPAKVPTAAKGDVKSKVKSAPNKPGKKAKKKAGRK